jgi:MoaA/NifB/PqqE/SkfB family radical SAM enzyme
MYTYDTIRHLHIELTTKCNAGCPMCARNSLGQTLKNLPLVQLSLADVKKIFPVDFVAQIEEIDFCGAYGDPAANRDLIPILRYFKVNSPDIRIFIYTNGGLRPADWWRSVAEVLGTNGKVIFAIDGLRDTNAIHRRFVNFDRVIENARAFIEAGGFARWEYLVFRHNEADLVDAREMSEQLGFSEFSVKRSGRFLEPLYEHVPEFANHTNLNAFPIHEPDGSISGYLEPPEDQSLVNPAVRVSGGQLDTYDHFEKLMESARIVCPVEKSRSVFISPQGHAYPCCWTYVKATRPEYINSPRAIDFQIVDLIRATGGYEKLDCKVQGLEAVIGGKFFEAVTKSWSCSTFGDGKLMVCARACGDKSNDYFNQFSSADLVPRGIQKPAATES